jgi:RHS repeat-associated protein
VNQLFTGKERDAETGLDYFGARYFSGAQGRFTSPDKPFVDQTESDPQSWNLYAYGRNNPLRYTDADGQACVSTDGGKTYKDENSGGQSCADVDAANKNKKPDVTVTARQGSALGAIALNALFALDNMANSWFHPLTSAMGVQPSYMQDTPVSDTGLGKYANAAVVIGAYLLGPGEEEAGIAITEHAVAAMAEHNVTPAMVKKAIEVCGSQERFHGVRSAKGNGKWKRLGCCCLEYDREAHYGYGQQECCTSAFHSGEVMIIPIGDLLKKLQAEGAPGDTGPAEALWVRFGQRKTRKTVEYRTADDEIVHVYLDENDILVGIEIFS